MSARLLLAGYFGCGNLGDDAILLGFLHGAHDLKHEVRVLAGSPERLMRQYGVRGVQRMDRGAVREAISQADALVFPGGSIFQDVTSVRSAFYYANLVTQAKKQNKKVVMLGQGVGPLKSMLGRSFAKKAFAAADAIAVRDPQSARELEELGVRAPIRIAADVAFLLPDPPNDESIGSFGVGSMKTIGIAPRPYGKKGGPVVKLFGDLMRLLYQNSYVPVLLEMDRNEDGPLIVEVGKTQGGKVPEVRGLDGPVQFQQRIMRMEAVIAMRLHAGILAVSAGVPSFMVSYDPKVSALAKELGQKQVLSVEDTDAPRLMNAFQDFLRIRERTLAELPAKRAHLAKLARVNIDVLRSCVG